MSERIRELLQQFRDGNVSEDEIIQRLVRQPFEEHILGRFDQTREARTGIPEAIFAEGKDPAAVADIFATYLERGEQLIATRVTPEILAGLERAGLLSDDGFAGRLHHFERARIVATRIPEVDERRKTVLVLSAGALDRPVAEEVVVTLRLLRNPTEFVADVGVAGVNRIAGELGTLDRCGIIVVVAGMDGVLPTFVGGLARQPVIAVPTSVGYGASFKGVSALLTMLNSCAPGTAVQNIDNGFGAAVLATKINRLIAGC